MARDPYYLPDDTFLSEQMLERIRRELPTPFYIYDAQGIRRTAQRLRAAFSWNAGYRQYFPVKALNNPAVLKLLLEEGIGLLCTSQVELETARRAGAGKEQLLFVPVFPLDADVAAASELGAPVILDSDGVLDRYLRAGKLPASVGLRVHPLQDIKRGVITMSKTEYSKFGMDPIDLLDLAKRLKELGYTELGLHYHENGDQGREAHWAQIAQTLVEAGRKLTDKTGLRISFYDLGGGLRIPGRPEETMPSVEHVSELVREKLAELGEEQTPVFTEFGRYLTGPHGLLFTQVQYLKPYREPRPVLGMDASSANLMRMALYQTYHHISVAGRLETEGRRFYAIAGPLSERRDKLASTRMIPQVQPGDLLVVHSAGAYCASMQMSYCGQLRCAEYLVDAEELRCIRRAETMEDYFATLEL